MVSPSSLAPLESAVLGKAIFFLLHPPQNVGRTPIARAMSMSKSFIISNLVHSSSCIFTEKSFSFLSADEIEKLKQENEKKIETIKRETKKKISSIDTAETTTTTSDNINNNDQFDINDNEGEFYNNKNLIISQHAELNDDDDEDDDEEDESMR